MLTGELLYETCRRALDPESPAVEYTDAHYFRFKVGSRRGYLSNFPDFFSVGFPQGIRESQRKAERLRCYREGTSFFDITGFGEGMDYAICRPRQAIDYLKRAYAGLVATYSLDAPGKQDEVIVLCGETYIEDISRHPGINKVYTALVRAISDR